MRSDTRMGRARRGLALLGLAAACACGSGDGPPESASTEAPAGPEVTGNRPPQLRGLHFEPDSPVAGERVTAKVEALDPDGDALRLVYAWQLDGRDARRSEASFDLPRDAKDQWLEVSVVAHDGQAESAPASFSVQVGNRPPELVDVLLEPAGGVTVESELTASARAVDPDGDPVEFRYNWLVNGRAVDVREPTLRAPHFKRGDVVVLEVRASDGEDESEPLRGPAITIENALPVVTSSPSGLDASGGLHYAPVVQDADGDRLLRFRLLEAPEGMTIDWLRGTISWTPTEQQSGEHAVEFQVEDGAGGVATQSFVLKVEFQPAEAPTPAAPAAAGP